MRSKNAGITRIAKILYSSLIGIFAVSLPLNAQQKKNIPRIGYLSSLSLADDSHGIESFKRELRALGQVEGKTVIVEYRFAQRNFRRLLELAGELVSRRVDLIITASSTPTRVAKAATSTIPIVMVQDSDPVGNEFVASLARPAGNITGLSSVPMALGGKQLAILKEIVPNLTRVDILANSINPGDAQAVKEAETAARQRRIQLQILDLRGSNDLETFLNGDSLRLADALLVLQSPIAFSRRTQIAHLAATTRVPAIYPATEFVEAGGLIGYGVDVNDLFRQAATYVDKILKGVKPSHLPVGQPSKFNLIINLKTAQRIAVRIPAAVIARADRVIR